jgi:hypothetical protein
LPKDAKVSISLDVVNYNNEERTIWMIGEMEYLPGKAAGLLPAAQQVIDLGMCSGVNGVDIRPPVGQKRFTIEGKDIIITRDGYFVYTRKSPPSQEPVNNAQGVISTASRSKIQVKC